jgi:hypothetical protein
MGKKWGRRKQRELKQNEQNEQNAKRPRTEGGRDNFHRGPRGYDKKVKENAEFEAYYRGQNIIATEVREEEEKKEGGIVDGRTFLHTPTHTFCTHTLLRHMSNTRPLTHTHTHTHTHTCPTHMSYTTP